MKSPMPVARMPSAVAVRVGSCLGARHTFCKAALARQGRDGIAGCLASSLAALQERRARPSLAPEALRRRADAPPFCTACTALARWPATDSLITYHPCSGAPRNCWLGGSQGPAPPVPAGQDCRRAPPLQPRVASVWLLCVFASQRIVLQQPADQLHLHTKSCECMADCRQIL